MSISLLLIDFVASTAAAHKAENAIQRKEKKKLPIPVRHLYIGYTSMLTKG